MSTTTPLRIAITGASGRMGRMLIETVMANPALALHCALDRADSPHLGRDAADFMGVQSGVAISADTAALKGAQVLIDFTAPAATLAHLQVCMAHQVNVVIGTTGFDEAGKAAIAAAGQRIGVVFAPNMSVGVNAVFKLLDVAARLLNSGYDIEIIEAHHRMKVDAPSGTALRMGQIVADALDRDLKQVAVYGREGHTGARDANTIGFATIRGGDVVGDHTVLFAGIGERIEITHKSSSRATYAQGSMRAAQFLQHAKPGVYDMQDVLGLK